MTQIKYTHHSYYISISLANFVSTKVKFLLKDASRLQLSQIAALVRRVPNRRSSSDHVVQVVYQELLSVSPTNSKVLAGQESACHKLRVIDLELGMSRVRQHK
jgi:hypothetical protein